ncbi:MULTISPECIES: ABC transporter substrate-binding protein [Actinoalloteichus]|uniref:ABC transporter substrate-binding protein n=1 Tax=Actinoalloteichus TaxID=65496 RepID=UPI001FE1A418|nr:ABC transporter substrate-binding protein [Actinoalloteichus caeruleus]
MRRRTLVVAVSTAALATACGSGDPLSEDTGPGNDGGGSTTITVGSADFAENQILMEIYAEVLRGTGAEVNTEPGVGSREFLVGGLEDGSLTVVPEYTGNLLYYVDTDAGETTPDDVYGALAERLPEGLAVLDQAEAQNSDVLTVTEGTAGRYGLETLDDLGEVCGELVLGAAGEWRDRWASRIQELYGCEFAEIRTTDAGGPITIDNLDDGTVDVANLFTTMPAIQEHGFVELEDTRQMYPAQNVVPLVRDGDLSAEQRDALNEVSARISTDDLTELARRVEVDRENYVDVARDFVERVLG